MKKGLGIMLAFICACGAFGFAACGDKSHEDAWETEYAYDEGYHWQICAGCDEEQAKEKHSGYDCGVCGFVYTPTDEVLYRVSDDGTYATAVEYIGFDTELFIASSYNGVPVTHIADNAFYQNEKLTKACIPGSVETIGKSAFDECRNLTKVVMMDGVLRIDDYAFRNCESLTEVVLPDTLTSMGYGAFYLCDALPKIVIPRGVTLINNYAFAYCYSITIYCEAESRPRDWDLSWNYGFPVVWGYTGE